MTVDVVGWIAVILTQVFYIPNVLKILRTRDVAGYSLFAWLLLTTSLACYLVYFVAREDAVGVVANACGVAGAGPTSACIWRWREAEQAPPALALPGEANH